MSKKIIGVFIFFFAFSIAHAQSVLKRDLLINKSTKIKKGNYNLEAYDSLSRSVLVIEGNNVTVDFGNAVLNGNTKNQLPDQFHGVAIIVRNGRNITIKNLTARGYKLAVIARNVEGLKIENCDFSYNYRQHLNSTQEKEDISDWLSHHHNENDECLRYGAAIYMSAAPPKRVASSRS